MEAPSWYFEPDEDDDFEDFEKAPLTTICTECNAVINYDKKFKDYYCEECDISFKNEIDGFKTLE